MTFTKSLSSLTGSRKKITKFGHLHVIEYVVMLIFFPQMVTKASKLLELVMEEPL